MKNTLILLVQFFALAAVIGAQQPSKDKPLNNWPPSLDNKQVCILGKVMTPSVIQLEGTITLMQGIKKAGGALPNTKSIRAFIYREMPDDYIMQIVVKDLRAIENGHAIDLAIQPHDIIIVLPRNKKEKVFLQDSEACGAKFLFILRHTMMHTM